MTGKGQFLIKNYSKVFYCCVSYKWSASYIVIEKLVTLFITVGKRNY